MMPAPKPLPPVFPRVEWYMDGNLRSVRVGESVWRLLEPGHPQGTPDFWSAHEGKPSKYGGHLTATPEAGVEWIRGRIVRKRDALCRDTGVEVQEKAAPKPDRAIYTDEGGKFLVEVLTDSTDAQGMRTVELRCVETIQPSPVHGRLASGYEFEATCLDGCEALVGWTLDVLSPLHEVQEYLRERVRETRKSGPVAKAHRYSRLLVQVVQAIERLNGEQNEDTFSGLVGWVRSRELELDHLRVRANDKDLSDDAFEAINEWLLRMGEPRRLRELRQIEASERKAS